MRRIHIPLLAALAGATAMSAAASANGQSPAAHGSRATALTVSHTALGSILTSSSGDTLYEFTRDHGAQDSCVKLSGCAAVWPPLQTLGKPSAGPGVRASLLSTIQLPGGAKQVTYAGHPLYLYSGDSAPRATGYVGVHTFGGSWDAVGPSGQTVR